jgi:glutathione S-transferase
MVTFQHKTPEYTAINPLQRMPALLLDDGTIITESIAICRYFEALHPEPRLFGQGAKDEAMVEMWQRRIEFHLLVPISQVFRHAHPAMKEMEVPQVPAWAESNKPRVTEFLEILDRELKERRFVAGDRYTVADITGLVCIDFMKPAKLAVPESLSNLKRWHAEVSARPSAKA